MINIKGLSKARVLASLYNASHPQGMGFLHYDPTPMTEEVAQLIANDNGSWNFDYLKGRVMKVDLSKDEFDPWLYDRDNGFEAAQNVINTLRSKDN